MDGSLRVLTLEDRMLDGDLLIAVARLRLLIGRTILLRRLDRAAVDSILSRD